MTDKPLHILLPTDLVTNPWHALQLVLLFDAKSRARVTLLHVVPASDRNETKQGFGALELLHNTLRLPPCGSRACPTIAKQSSLELGPAANRLRRKIHPEWNEFLEIETAQRHGDVAQEILRFARDAEVDMIVLASKPRKRFWLRASVSDTVLRRATCRVVQVHDPQPIIQSTLVAASLSNELNRAVDATV